MRCITIIGHRGRRGSRPTGKIGSEIVCSVIDTDHSIKLKKAKRGQVHRAVVVRTPNERLRKDGGFMRMDHSAAVLISKEKKEPLGSRIKGPISAGLDRKKFIKLFSLARISLFSSLATHRGVYSSTTTDGRR